MIRIAVLSEQVSSQLTAPEARLSAELERIDVVWTGTSLQELQKRAPQLRPQVLLVELGLLGESPRKLLDDLLAATQAELALVLYHFAPREAVQRLQGERSRPVKAPLSLTSLRMNMLSLLIRDTLQKSSPSAEPESPAAASSQELRPVLMPALTQGQAPSSPAQTVSTRPLPPESTRTLPPGKEAPALPEVGTAKLFSPTQLGRLQEYRSAIKCECPSHLAELIASLAAFEDYSKACENKNDSDAAMHARLYRDSSRARRLLEESLQALCKFENITP